MDVLNRATSCRLIDSNHHHHQHSMATTKHLHSNNTVGSNSVPIPIPIPTAATTTTLATTAAASTVASSSPQLSPSSCSVLIVDKRFLKGVYHTTGEDSIPTLRAGPARDDVVFVQELLEIYGQVVAVLSGDTALRWIFSHTGSKTILVLIDIDEDDVCDPAETGTTVASESFLDSSSLIYTPPHSPHDPHSLSQHHHSNSESEATGPYGLSLLRIIAHYVAIGVFRNVAPIAMSVSHQPSFMRQAASLGAMNYLVKPISAETVHSLWLNVFSCRSQSQTAGAAASSSHHSGNGCCDSQHYSEQPRGGSPKLQATTTTNSSNSSMALVFSDDNHSSRGDRSTLQQQQTIFQRRIRSGIINVALTSDIRNGEFEEDFIRQFVPAISDTLPTRATAVLLAADDEHDEDFISSPRAEFLRSQLLEWSFCPYEMEIEDLIDCAVIMIMDSAACVDLELRHGRIRRFVKILESAYYDNPYHNFCHAIDVTQCTFYMLHTIGLFNKTGVRRSSLKTPSESSFPIRSILRAKDGIALVVASMCHDLGHPGLNNAFMVKVHTQLAEIYNDQSVLENFHAACFSMIMSYFFTDFATIHPDTTSSSATAFDYEEFRRIAIHAILATDMARHFEFIGECRAQYERFLSGSNLPLSGQQHEKERAQLAASILKCADISNIVRPFDISRRWTKRLNQEVTLQGNIEESLGLDRSIVVDLENIPSSQIAFYEACGRPLFNTMADLVPELRFMADQLENNIRNWRFIKLNEKMPKIPYGLKHTSALRLSINIRSSSTDSAPDFLSSNRTFDSPAIVEEDSEDQLMMANYTLHIGGNTMPSDTTADNTVVDV